jgi:hypothetical protein
LFTNTLKKHTRECYEEEVAASLKEPTTRWKAVKDQVFNNWIQIGSLGQDLKGHRVGGDCVED